jgi:hypothetical protein
MRACCCCCYWRVGERKKGIKWGFFAYINNPLVPNL